MTASFNLIELRKEKLSTMKAYSLAGELAILWSSSVLTADPTPIVKIIIFCLFAAKIKYKTLLVFITFFTFSYLEYCFSFFLSYRFSFHISKDCPNSSYWILKINLSLSCWFRCFYWKFLLAETIVILQIYPKKHSLLFLSFVKLHWSIHQSPHLHNPVW